MTERSANLPVGTLVTTTVPPRLDLFPVEIRGIASGSRRALVAGACLAAALMVAAGLAAAVLAEDAEGKSLEHLAGDPGAPHPAP